MSCSLGERVMPHVLQGHHSIDTLLLVNSVHSMSHKSTVQTDTVWDDRSDSQMMERVSEVRVDLVDRADGVK